MPDPLTLRIQRPYATVEEYLEAEATSITSRGMLLFGAESLAEGTLIRFSVSLLDGEPVIKAEGRVRSAVPASEGRPGGIRVQFKRFGASTKAFIDRALELHHGNAEESDPEASGVLGVGGRAEGATPPPEPRADASDADAPPPSPPENVRAVPRSPAARGPVVAPSEREVLLDQLRSRARALTPERIAELTRRPD